MEGGINAWNGLVAEGPPESGMAYFSSATKPEELIVLAWHLEDGASKFYSEMTQRSEDREAQDLFKWLVTEEERHKASLLQLNRKLSGMTPDQVFQGSAISSEEGGDVMEGGMSVHDVLMWAREKTLIDVLDLSLSLETHTYDLFLKMGRQVEDQNSEEIFQVLAKETKEHLERLSSFLEKRI